MKFLLSVFLVIVTFVLVLVFSKKAFHKPVSPEPHQKNSYSFLIADTPEKRKQGLSGIDSLPASTVLLFSFDTDSNCGIWMKNMKFSIDTIWLDRDFKVIDFKEKLSPLSYPEIFYPSLPCRYLIEAKEGFIKDNSVKISNKVFIDFENSKLNF